MADTGVPAGTTQYTWSHPAYSPAAGSPGDDVTFADRGINLKLSGGLAPKDVIENRTGDQDSGDVMAAAVFRTADDITANYTQPSGGLGDGIAGFFDTVKNDATRREATLTITWRPGDTTTCYLLVESNMPVPVPGGALTGVAVLKHERPPVEVRA